MALAEGASPRATILGFAVVVAIGIIASAIKLLGRPDRPVRQPAVAEAA